MAPENWLDTVEKLSRVLSIAAIPVALAIGGWLIQRQLQLQSIRRDYVRLALTILQNVGSKVRPEIREWAVDLLNDNSPTKLSPKAYQSLKLGLATLPAFSFVPGSTLTPSQQQMLQRSLEEFKNYLLELGFKVPEETISVKISRGTTIDRGGKTWVAYWDPGTRLIEVASAFANDEASVLRQFTHDPLAPPESSSWDYFALESGLATYFPCSFANHAVMGDQASSAGKVLFPPQDLRNERKFSEIQLADWGSVQNDGSVIWGGALWEIREILGPDNADPVIAQAWLSLSPANAADSAFRSFANALLKNAASLDGGKSAAKLKQVFQKRELLL